MAWIVAAVFGVLSLVLFVLLLRSRRQRQFVIRYPSAFKNEDGSLDAETPRQQATRMLELLKHGEGIALPNTRDNSGQFAWDIVWSEP